MPFGGNLHATGFDSPIALIDRVTKLQIPIRQELRTKTGVGSYSGSKSIQFY